MWPTSQQGSSTGGLQPPTQARTRVPFRSHEDPTSMGDDAYIHEPSSSTRAPSSIHTTSTSEDAHSRTGLRGAGAGMGATAGGAGTGAHSRSSSAAGSQADASEAEDEGVDGMVQAGMPIGFLAAIGTPYAKKPLYRSRKCKILCPILGIVILAVAIVIGIFPVLRAIAVHTLHTSVLTISASNITSPTNNNFTLTLEGQAHKVGIFPAKLAFERPVVVYWTAPENPTVELELGQFALDPIGVAAGHGRIKQETFFRITNETGFARFTQCKHVSLLKCFLTVADHERGARTDLITQEEFTWRLRSQHVQAKAFGFIAANGLDFVKDVTLPGMANFTDVSISDFQLPGDDPAGGISLSVVTQLTNPSAFGVEIGTLVVGLYYQDLYLGPAQTASPTNLTAGVNHIHLVGRLIDYSNNTAALDQLSYIFTQYLNGESTPVEARGVSVTLPSGQVIDWLQAGISALTLNVPLSSPTGRISPITGINIEALSLAFDPTTAYAPMANSSDVSASFGLPFGFSLDIVSLSNEFSIVDNRTAIASLNAPMGDANTTILTMNAGYTTGELTLDLPLAPLQIGPTYDEHLAFSQFTYDLTTTNGSTFALVGNTTAVTNTPLGQVKLDGIGFTVPAGLIGLESLAAYPTTILSVDVTGGTTDAIELAITVGLTNPSNIDLEVGDVTFQLFNGKSFLGTATLPALHLTRGYQEHNSTSLFQANNNPVALQTLTDYAQGVSNNLTISGFNGSTAVDSLTQAFMAIHLNATLNGLTTKLLNYANLTVLTTTGVTNDLSNSIVSLQNPFSSSLSITNIQSNVTSHGLFVGSINTDTDFTAAGKTANISPILGLDLNLYPPDIFSLLRVLAVEANLDTAQIDGIVALGGYTLTPSTSTARKSKRSLPQRSMEDSLEDTLVTMGGAQGGLQARSLSKRNIYTGFDLPSYVLEAFAGLTVDVQLLSVLHIGQFRTDLAYSQDAVPAYTDSTLTLLLPVLARPIVQKIVDQAVLNVSTVMISDPSNTAFTTGLVGSLSDSGPFDAVITFPTGLIVAWDGAPLGTIAMPNISITGDVGATLDLSASFSVTDLDHLTNFTGYLLTEPAFTWQIYSQNISISALGISVDGISISKTVNLNGMNGFKNQVTIESFDLPSNDPAGGVTLTLQTSLTNPSSVGVDLSTIGFSNTFGSTTLGPASSTAAFSLLPKATIQLPLAGRLVPQTTTQGLADVSTLFNGYLHGVPSNLVVHGTNAGPSGVSWLNTGIQQLSIAVVLPAAENLQVINGITINQVTLMFNESNGYSPSFSTNNTVATFQLPFAFPVAITQLATQIDASDSSGSSRLSRRAAGDFASLDVPSSPATTDEVARTVLLQFSDVPFKSTDNSLFSNFLLSTTDGANQPFGLSGSADSEATFHGYPRYLQINVNAHLYNPSSQITIGTGDVAFGLQFQNELIGTADITNLILVPGANVIATAVHYAPSGSAETAAGQVLLENFIQGIASTTLIVGNDGTTNIDSLKAALESIQLTTTIPPLEQNLITEAKLTFPLNIADTSVADATFMLGNPFTAEINLISVVTNATYNGIFLGQINEQNLNPAISAPGHTTINSPTLPFELNTDPKALIQFVEAAATAQSVDLGILLPEFAYVLGLSSTASSVTSSVNQQPETCAPTGTTREVQALILAAIKNLKTNLTIQSVVKLDDYETPLNFDQNDVTTDLDSSVLYLTGILGKTIVSHIVDDAELSFSSGEVTNVTDSGFTVALNGSLLNAGPFDAQIEFPDGVTVIWDGSDIATIALPPICSSGGSGVPSLQTTGILTITDLSRFTDFATYILLNPSFTWTITTNTLRVLALQTIFDNVTLTKNVSFSAFNGLPGVTISNPDFPGDASNGIELETDTLIPSPSNLGIQLGTTTFIASFEGQEVGPIAANDLTLAPLTTTSAHLTGTIVKRSSTAGLNSLGVLFSNFLQGENQTLQVTGQEVVSPAQPNSPVNWLSAAFKKLTLNVTLPGETFTIISSIQLQDLTVTITEQSEAYAVPSQNNETDVVYKNPFGFSLTAVKAGGEFYINYDGVDTALLTLPVADVVSAQTSTGQDANLVIDFKNKEDLVSLNNPSFDNFFNAITNTADVSFILHGGANVSAETAAGTIPITGIPFSVNTSFLGLQSLNARPTVVSNLDVYHGYPTYLQINADATIYNPSNLTIITNDVVFGLQFEGQVVGSVDIGDLLLVPQDNLIGTEVHYAPTGGASTVAGEALLANYVQGVDSNVSIVGTANTTPYGSLQEALGTISIQTSIPAIHQLLITEALLSFPIDIASNGGIANAKFDLANPFTASINLLGVVANATYENFFLGQINQPTLSPEITAGGHKNITSRTAMPEFAYVLAEASTTSNVTTSVNTGKETCAPTGTTAEVQALILKSVANLKTDLEIQSTLKLDDFQTDLAFNQTSVPTVLDDSVLYLTGIIGKTIVTNIVDGATLSFSSGNVTNVTDSGFTVALQGSLLNAGPFDALISFPNGVDVIWEGNNMANIILPPICSPGSTGVPDLQTTGILQITDLSAFTDFAAYLLLNPSFNWTITTPTLRVEALQTIFDNVTLTKEISFLAFNKLQPGVQISNPDFPGDSSSLPGIELTLNSLIPSPSNLGIVLGDVAFIASYEGSEIGPVNGKDLTLPPLTTTEAPLTGTIIYRDDAAGLNSLGEVFSRFLVGENTTLQVTGDSVVSPSQPKSPVNWLSAAFKQFTFNATLPGQTFTIISNITLEDLTVTIDDAAEAYAALVTNNKTDVVFKNPFGFTLEVTQAGGDFTINYNGVDSALLTLPKEDAVTPGTSTGQPADLTIHIATPAVLSSLNNAGYADFFSAVTNTADVGFILHGGANVTATTKAGAIPIGGIPFSVDTSFPGLNGFGGTAQVPQIPLVVGSGGGDEFSQTEGSEFIRITLTVYLDNPAPLILLTNQVSFATIYQGYQVGRTYINTLDLYTGNVSIPAEFHYQPADPSNSIAQSLLATYLETTGQIALTVDGDTSSSPYGSLQEALSGIKLSTSFPGLGKSLVNDIVIYLDLITVLCTNEVSFEFRNDNNLDTSLTLLSIDGTASQSGTEYASYDFKFSGSGFRTEAGQLPGAYSEKVTPTKLTQGALASLVLFGTEAEGLDIDLTASVLIDEYNAPSLVYSQKAVPYTIMVTAGNTSLDLASLGSDPIGTLTGIIGSLGEITTCINGGTALSLISVAVGDVTSLLGDLTNLPGVLTSLIGGVGGLLSEVLHPNTSSVASAVSSVVANVTSDVGSIVSGATSLVGSVVSGAGSAAGSVVSDVTSAAGGVVSGATSVVGDVTSLVGGVLSGVTAAAATTTAKATTTTSSANVVAAATSAAGSVAAAATSVVGGVLSDVLGKRDMSPTTPLPTPTQLDDYFSTVPASASPTPAPKIPDTFAYADPAKVQNILKAFGVRTLDDSGKKGEESTSRGKGVPVKTKLAFGRD
ncbi:pre-rrna processing protein [Pseudohyphozyma bogoriensis]|nr:pre-rrna processing protein [Pseudohyphozyma bogoriensis]